jgi:hypothetical protein
MERRNFIKGITGLFGAVIAAPIFASNKESKNLEIEKMPIDVIHTVYGKDIILYSNNKERMRISADGTFSIGGIKDSNEE